MMRNHVNQKKRELGSAIVEDTNDEEKIEEEQFESFEEEQMDDIIEQSEMQEEDGSSNEINNQFSLNTKKQNKKWDKRMLFHMKLLKKMLL